MQRKVEWTDTAREQFTYWKQNDTQMLNRIKDLIHNIQETPFHGIGKSEPLKYDYAGYWSRRINREHRLVYSVENSTIIIVSCRYHY